MGVKALALENAMIELILLAKSPDKYCAIVSARNGMVRAANDSFHAAEIRDLGRVRLNLDILRAT